MEAAFGTVIINGTRFKNPAPRKMYWRPDKQICEYEVGGVTIKEEKSLSRPPSASLPPAPRLALVSFISLLPLSGSLPCLFSYLRFRLASLAAHAHAFLSRLSPLYPWLHSMLSRPADTTQPSPEYPPTLRFVAANDVISTIITSDVPVTIEFSGKSYSNSRSETSHTSLPLERNTSFLLLLSLRPHAARSSAG